MVTILVSLHDNLDNHVHTLDTVQTYLFFVTLHGNLDNYVHTLICVQAY